MIKKITYIIVAIVIFISGFAISKMLFDRRQTERTEANATVLLEQVQQVMKLVTVEGTFSEIYDSRTTKDLTVFLPLPSTFSFPKTATVHVLGKVLVGYDMEGISMTIDTATRTIYLSDVPTSAEILAVDHELRYKNLDESFFNKFKADDYTAINKKAKEVLEQKAFESGLMSEAMLQGNQMLEVMTSMASSAGYRVVIDGKPSTSPLLN